MKRQIVSTVSDLCIASGESAVAPPKCEHGFALRFTRADTKTNTSRDFYACSVTRDRKVCNLFYWIDEWEKRAKRAPAASFKAVSTGNNPKKLRADESLGVPAIADNKSNAQYLFDSESIDNIVTVITSYCDSKPATPLRILCIGTPSVHQRLIKLEKDSTLLDEDERLCSLIPNTSRFNMFNGNWYGKPLKLDNFDIVVLDPPFQPALLPALQRTLEQYFPISIRGLVLMAFPYFNQEEVEKAHPMLKMTDVRLTYRNHRKFNAATRSPVRLYSSLNLCDFTQTALPTYRKCTTCTTFSHESNTHCEKCNKCTTIAGPKPYVHCEKCQICVKPGAKHCHKCARCFVSEHSCR